MSPIEVLQWLGKAPQQPPRHRLRLSRQAKPLKLPLYLIIFCYY